MPLFLLLFTGHSCLDLYKNHVQKARDQRVSKENATSGHIEYMFYPRKVAEKFEANLPPNWTTEGYKGHKAHKLCHKRCPSFVTKFFNDRKVRNTP